MNPAGLYIDVELANSKFLVERHKSKLAISFGWSRIIPSFGILSVSDRQRRRLSFRYFYILI